ncbi:MAG: hypothetical protein BWZ10_01486 [candidate division BRC1 bacterium ADurb.BinA364]|nr:MAG: hypothetical protein BWZ10_01486 [candidate division BRC1 bacterium ADurb.BinA364]
MRPDRLKLALAISLCLNCGFLLAAFVKPVIADGTAKNQSKPIGRHGTPCSLHQHLGVSSEQWDKIEPRLAEFQTRAGERRARMMALRLELVDLLAAESPDAKAIQDKQNEILEAQRQMQALVIDNLLAEKDSLTPKQREEFFAIMREECSRGGLGMAMGAYAEKSGGR